MTPPPLTREARDWLLNLFTSPSLITAINAMPLAPADPLDTIRARFQPKTQGGGEYEIHAVREFGSLYGKIFVGNYHYPAHWTAEGKSVTTGAGSGYDEWNLLPASPHSALIAELVRAEAYLRHNNDTHADAVKRAADALEAIEVQK